MAAACNGDLPVKRFGRKALVTLLAGGILMLAGQTGFADPVLDGLIVANGDFRLWEADKPSAWLVPAGVTVARNDRGEVSFTNNTDQRQYVNQSYPGPELALQPGDVLLFSAEIMAPEKSAVTLEIWVRYLDESLGKREISVPVPAENRWTTLRCALPIENIGVKHVWFLIGLRTPGSSCVVRRVDGRVVPSME